MYFNVQSRDQVLERANPQSQEKEDMKSHPQWPGPHTDTFWGKGFPTSELWNSKPRPQKDP